MRKKDLLISTIALNIFSLSVLTATGDMVQNGEMYVESPQKNNEASPNYGNNRPQVPSAPLRMNEDRTVESSYMEDTSERNKPATVENKRRNEVLRESSHKVYSDGKTEAGWVAHTLFYDKPSLESIKDKYKKSNFAGCMQEAESYVTLNPTDSLGFYYLAMAYSKVGDQQNAIKAYEKVIALNPNPMLVKYATNGRNCVLGGKEMCYQNVNEPEYIYPYANVASGMDLTPVDVKTLINRNLKALEQKLNAPPKENTTTADNSKNGDNNNQNQNQEISLPFGTQDEKLDAFIRAPYGNGLSPELNTEYKQIQLKKIQQSINSGKNDPENEYNNVEFIKKFDHNKSDSEEIKLAYDSSNFDDLKNNPEYMQYKKEYEELQLLLGGDAKKGNDFTDLILKQDQMKNLSPEMLQAIMLRDMMPDMNFVNTNELL